MMRYRLPAYWVIIFMLLGHPLEDHVTLVTLKAAEIHLLWCNVPS